MFLEIQQELDFILICVFLVIFAFWAKHDFESGLKK
jgi:hypothetical protein